MRRPYCLEAHSYVTSIKMAIMVMSKETSVLILKKAGCPSISTSYTVQNLNKIIISCHTLTPRPCNPALEKRTVLYTTEVSEFIPETRMWHLQRKKIGNWTVKTKIWKKKSVERNEGGGGKYEKKRHINGRMIGEMRTRKPRTRAWRLRSRRKLK